MSAYKQNDAWFHQTLCRELEIRPEKIKALTGHSVAWIESLAVIIRNDFNTDIDDIRSKIAEKKKIDNDKLSIEILDDLFMGASYQAAISTLNDITKNQKVDARILIRSAIILVSSGMFSTSLI